MDGYMSLIDYYKNFNMGRELETAGEFIYESMREMYALKSFNNHYQINKILYSGAIGIERLQKIFLCIHLMNSYSNFENPPVLLLEHNHIALHDRAKKIISIPINKNQENLLRVFQEYYNNHRYGEFLLEYDCDSLKELFSTYFTRITKVSYHLVFPNNPSDFEVIRRTYINNLGIIAREYFKLVHAKANELNILTTELSYNSNASKVFFLRNNEKMYERIKLESLAIKELLIYLSKFNSRANVKKITSKIKKIEFDPSLINDYLSDITSFRASNELTDFVENYYEDTEDSKKLTSRLKLVELIGDPSVILD